VAYEPIKPSEIYERDGWRCKLCHKKVNKRLKYPHPKSASLDHIVPMAEGGGHVKANVQLAHFICNSLKSAGGSAEQLRLIG
jgi:5-methylcytosine-specific restriction endonuclease McrA